MNSLFWESTQLYSGSLVLAHFAGCVETIQTVISRLTKGMEDVGGRRGDQKKIRSLLGLLLFVSLLLYRWC